MNDPGSWITLPGLVAAAGLIFSYFTLRTTQYQRVTDVLDYISSAEVAHARHNLGTFLHPRPGTPPRTFPATPDTPSVGGPHDAPTGTAVPTRDDLVKDLFTVLWALSRINAVRRSLPAVPFSPRRRPLPLFAGPHNLLRDTTAPWVVYWHHNLTPTNLLRLELDPDDSITGSDQALRELSAAWPAPASSPPS